MRSAGPGVLGEPHHDGSGLYAPGQPAALGEEAAVRLRVPRESAAERVVLRYVGDGEPRAVEAVVDEEHEHETWWLARFPARNPSVRYRWLLSGGRAGYRWLNGAGTQAHDVPDADDFVLSLAGAGPDWHLGSVVYEVFPDRFASSGRATGPPEWAVPRPWGALPAGRGPTTQFEWFGGDLAGVEARLDHVVDLGATALYLTPVFPAGSTHRYDAASFDTIDPLLGGDAALAALTAAAHARGLRVLGDLTLNHCGARHEWFTRALGDAGAPERSLFYFDEALPGGYESWYGVRSLPKLNWDSPELRRRMLAAARRWLEPPYELDGWRIDVANMAGRFGEIDLTREAARAVRAAVRGVRADALLVAEHGHDFRGDLGGDGWHGTMNYAGFLRPVWQWLRGELSADLRKGFWGLPVGLPRLAGPAVTATMRAFRAGIPWSSTLHSWALLDSHDTARFRTVAGSRGRHLVGLGLQMTAAGVPMVFAGDELGLEGEWGEDARRTMPWDEPQRWDRELLADYRRLIALRHGSEALQRGGLRYAAVADDAIAYLRETAGERLLCLAARAGHEPLRLPLAGLGAVGLEPLEGGEARVERGVAVLPGDGPAFHVWRLQ